jgi:hypothetical protein
LSTHPSDENRIRNIERWIPEVLKHNPPATPPPSTAPPPSPIKPASPSPNWRAMKGTPDDRYLG